MPEIPFSLEEFSYDLIGNRVSSNDDHGESSYDSTGQILFGDSKYDYLHDDNGNLIQKNEKGAIDVNYVKYDYSSSNQLVRVEEYNEDGLLVKEIDYLYGATGQRIEKVVIDNNNSSKSFTRRYAYIGDEVSAELDENNTILAKYTHSGLRTDDVLAVDVQSAGINKIANEAKSYFFLKDALGTITAIADLSGIDVQHNVYSVFGKLLKIEDGNGNDVTDAPILDPYFTFTGREYDKETGLYYYRARYYDPALGRFLASDPHPGDTVSPISITNKYVYTANSPVNGIDPSGKSFESFFASLISIVASNYDSENYGGNITIGVSVNFNTSGDFTNANIYYQNNLAYIGLNVSPLDVNFQENARIASQMTIREFYNAVKTDGVWDYKQFGRRYENLGNYHYGYVGSATWFGFPWILRSGAGVYQIYRRNWRPGFGVPFLPPYYADDPVDQKWINLGISGYSR